MADEGIKPKLVRCILLFSNGRCIDVNPDEIERVCEYIADKDYDVRALKAFIKEGDRVLLLRRRK